MCVCVCVVDVWVNDVCGWVGGMLCMRNGLPSQLQSPLIG